MRPRLALASAALLLAGAGLSGCASAAQTGGSGSGSGSGDVPAPSALAGDWNLVSATDADGRLDLDGPRDMDGLPIALTIDGDGGFAGRTTCNSYSGTLVVVAGSVTFGPLAMTEAACQAPRLMELERRYIDALSAATTVRIDPDVQIGLGEEVGDVLVIGDGASVDLRFEPEGEVDPDTTAVAGTSWTLTAVMRGDVLAEAAGTGTLVFSPDGTALAGSGGCHCFTSAYTLSSAGTGAGGVVVIAGLEVAHSLCPEGTDAAETAAQEDAVFGVLGDGLVVIRDGQTLTARNAVGGVPVSLVYSFQAS